jgi:MFS transporter, DHA2 family, metal-tetracycline-proton antiporter
MNTEATMTAAIPASAEARKSFAVCFAALVATSFCFILRAFSVSAWGTEFSLSQEQIGQLNGVGLWPFAISIVLLSLIVDRVGFKVLLWFAAACHALGLVIILQADGYWPLYWGSFVLSLGNGAVEAAINPLTAAQFRHDKTTWLNRLHAGWPAGFVIGGLLALALPADMGWRYKMALILIPVITYVVMLIPRKFPQSERVAAGVSYREMLAEAGFISAFVIAALMILEIGRVFGLSTAVQWSIIAALTIGYGIWSRSAGRPFFILMILIMILLATTELGTDSWITPMMEPAMAEIGLSSGWVLIYTMALVLVLRLFAGPLVHKFSPVGLLAIAALLAAIGLVALSAATSAVMVLLAATVFGLGKAFFWPTSLGVVAEQSPRGGAITLNVVAAVGMLGVGIIGNPGIGKFQDTQIVERLAEHDQAKGTQLHDSITREQKGLFGTGLAVDPGKVAQSSPDVQATVADIKAETDRQTLRAIAILPLVMLLAYIGMIFYFRGKGGYKPVVLDIKH